MTLTETEATRAVAERPGTPEHAWPHRHLLDADVLTWPQIELVLDTARHMAGIVAGERPRSSALRGIGVTNLFYESSTRTRVSFEVAAKHLSADVVNAGDGWHGHPTQALLDLYTLGRHIPGGSLRGRKVVIL